MDLDMQNFIYTCVFVLIKSWQTSCSERFDTAVSFFVVSICSRAAAASPCSFSQRFFQTTCKHRAAWSTVILSLTNIHHWNILFCPMNSGSVLSLKIILSNVMVSKHVRVMQWCLAFFWAEWANYVRVQADISARSPQQTFIVSRKSYVHSIKVSQKHLILLWKQKHCGRCLEASWMHNQSVVWNCDPL